MDSITVQTPVNIMAETNASSGVGFALPPGAPLEATLLSLATIMTVFGNFGTLAAFVSDPSLHQKPSNLLLVSLSVADLLMGLIVLPLRVVETALGYWPLKEELCMVEVFFADIALTVAIFTVTAISVDRYLLVAKDYSRYVALQSLTTVRITICSIWVLVLLSALLEMILWWTDALQNRAIVNFDFICLPPVKLDERFLYCIFIFGFFIPLLIILFCSIGFMHHLRKRLKGKIHANGDFGNTEMSASAASTAGRPRKTAWTTVTASPPRGSVVNNALAAPPPVNDGASTTSAANGQETRETRRKLTVKNRYLKPAITMAALLAVFTACTLPYLVIAAIITPICTYCIPYATRVHVANLMFANSCINPILYAVTQNKIRQFYRTHVFSFCLKRRR
ncbi:5-hydroxytryptamine receptor-like [Asterias rubens]|uniref:5-hydroxytryptamine receptor-like n=1 Tax=Asterias rubens TaxID=7604 RepID=UPI001454E496|nr:5-hydroxytryptamine receptor-like [Asterias rubens]